MGYTRYDFQESLDRAVIDPATIEHVIAAWGESPEGYGSWEGGFLLAMRDGRTAYLTGWADTSGWGCQDGAFITYFDAVPSERATLPGPSGIDWGVVGEQDWDDDPADLNLSLAQAAA